MKGNIFTLLNNDDSDDNNDNDNRFKIIDNKKSKIERNKKSYQIQNIENNMKKQKQKKEININKNPFLNKQNNNHTNHNINHPNKRNFNELINNNISLKPQIETNKKNKDNNHNHNNNDNIENNIFLRKNNHKNNKNKKNTVLKSRNAFIDYKNKQFQQGQEQEQENHYKDIKTEDITEFPSLFTLHKNSQEQKENQENNQQNQQIQEKTYIHSWKYVINHSNHTNNNKNNKDKYDDYVKPGWVRIYLDKKNNTYVFKYGEKTEWELNSFKREKMEELRQQFNMMVKEQEKRDEMNIMYGTDSPYWGMKSLLDFSDLSDSDSELSDDIENMSDNDSLYSNNDFY